MGEFMDGNGQMDFLTDEQLLSFFRRKKTEISCIKQPHIFLTQLKDHDLLPETLFKKVKAMRTQQKQKGVYEVLNWLEKERPQQIRHFWRCVFEYHIVQKYTTLLLLKKSLPDAVTKFSEELPGVVRLTEKSGGKGKNGSQSKNTRKRNGDDRSSEESDGPGPSSASTRPRKKPVKKTPSSSPETGNKKIWMLSEYKTELPIKCGDKEGTLHRDKLAKGEKCILVQKRWFTPSEFEKFGGKGGRKKWKLSIYCGNTPLKTLIEENHLQCPSPVARKKTCVRKRKKQIPVSSSESSSPDLETSSSSEEESESEDFQKQTRRAEGRSLFRSRVDDDDDDEEEEVADLTVFQAPTLPVIGASLTGTLYKNRFKSGRRGKSIRTEERWFTPEEFVKEELTLIEGLWTRDILCHGKTLNLLIKKKVLQIHLLKCKCKKCRTQPEHLMEQNNDDECYACHSGGDLVCCDKCPRAFHSDCHLPAVYDEDSPGEWVCTFCERTSQQRRGSSNMTEQEAFDAPVSQYLLQCRYLLLCMYKVDMQRVFVKDPRRTVDRYAEFISQPMWLDRIKLKLETKKYQKVGEFISDFRLIFNNSSKFNRDNKFGQLGATMKEIFVKEMQKIFCTQYTMEI